ncbi:hypothetical protein LC55x_0292 [Lysobacter capsici]|nr:hypothetical protein LC55x_0292 [Lysobacter capsici]
MFPLASDGRPCAASLLWEQIRSSGLKLMGNRCDFFCSEFRSD